MKQRLRRFVGCIMKRRRTLKGEVEYYNKFNLFIRHKSGLLYTDIPIYGVAFNMRLYPITEVDRKKGKFIYDFTDYMKYMISLENLPGIHKFHVMVDAEELEKRINANEKNLCS